MSKQGRIRICKRKLFKGFPYYVAVDLPKKGCAWYLRADGTLSPDCCDDTDKQVPNSGWFADMAAVDAAIRLYEESRKEAINHLEIVFEEEYIDRLVNTRVASIFAKLAADACKKDES